MKQRLKELRKQLNLTQNELANRLGLGVSTVTNWEKTGSVPARQIERISRMFGVNAEWLETGNGAVFTAGKPVFRDEENDLKHRLKYLRKTLGYTQQEFADRLNFALSNISNWELTGNMPKAKRMLVCNVLGVNLSWLETGDGEMFDSSSQPLATPREYALKHGCDEVTATIFERFISLSDKEKRVFARLLTQIVSGSVPDPSFQVSPEDLHANSVDGSIVLKGHVTSRDITVNNYGKTL